MHWSEKLYIEEHILNDNNVEYAKPPQSLHSLASELVPLKVTDPLKSAKAHLIAFRFVNVIFGVSGFRVVLKPLVWNLLACKITSVNVILWKKLHFHFDTPTQPGLSRFALFFEVQISWILCEWKFVKRDRYINKNCKIYFNWTSPCCWGLHILGKALRLLSDPHNYIRVSFCTFRV